MTNYIIIALMLFCVAWIAWPFVSRMLLTFPVPAPAPDPQPEVPQWTKLDRVEAWEMIYAVADDSEKPVLEKMLPRIVRGPA